MTEKMNDPEDLQPRERAVLEKLFSEKTPPKTLEDKTVSALKSRGLVRSASASYIPYFLKPLGAFAAAALVFAAGFWAGNREEPQTPQKSSKPVFALFIYDTEAMTENDAVRTRVYSQWVGETAASGRFASGTKLEQSGRIIRPAANRLEVIDRKAETQCGDLRGYILLEAENMDEAVKIASTNPHLRYKGVLEVRELFRFNGLND